MRQAALRSVNYNGMRCWGTKYDLGRKGTGFSVGKLLQVETYTGKCSQAIFLKKEECQPLQGLLLP